MALAEKYDPKEAEPRIQKLWEQTQTYKFDPKSTKPIYSIDTPPPTVSGKMHLGHAFSYTQGDIIARYQRMKGKNVFYPFGTDDNGLATEKLIEKTKNVVSKKMERNEFIKLCLKTLEEIRPGFVNDWKKIGISCDFSIFYSTINDHCRKLSQKSFIDLYKAGRIYQKKAPIIFCPHCKTAIAQVEMEDTERKSTLNYIKAKIDGTQNEFIIYSTTRPELHPACVGVSINQEGDYVRAKRPDAEMWVLSKEGAEKLADEFGLQVIETFKGTKLVGKKVVIPFAQEKIPISHDISAKTEYGTGVVYYCSYGGLDCVEWMARHPETTAVHIMDESGTYIAPSPYHGKNSEQARVAVLEDLEKAGMLLKKQPLTHMVNTHERCGTDIEYVATKQWFVAYLDLREHFLESGAKLNWYPPHMKVRYDNWIKGLKWDWCISRQRHFGIPMPVWYHKKTGEVILPSLDQLPVDPLNDVPKGYSKEDVIAEKDVLDTWATSSLTPHLAVELFDDPALKKKLIPMNLRPQAHDIITFWLFNTLVKEQLHHHQNPWHDVVISGHAQDPHGRKMSKSKGNVIEPQVMVDKYCADALRFWAAGSKLGDDLPFQEKDLLTGQKFVTKLWNASKFSMLHLEGYEGTGKATELIDRFVISRLQSLIQECSESFDRYEYVRTKAEVEKFFWHIFCDNYLEIVKDRLYNPDVRGAAARTSGQYTLYHTLLTIVKMIAPVMPHITEEIYQNFFKEGDGAKSVHLSHWPTVNTALRDEQAEKLGEIMLDIIATVRKYKSEKNLSMKEDLKKLVLVGDDVAELVEIATGDLKAVLRVGEIVTHGTTTLETEKFKIKIGVE
ncbi:valine--tRNA ligase [Candidatus Woesearchaeota archaeon]|nr:valine--tRNA ligase [Candidatus Woesearchaeota archaeon]